MGKYMEDAKELLQHVGGKENIAAVSHCMTRMRFVLNDRGSIKGCGKKGRKAEPECFTEDDYGIGRDIRSFDPGHHHRRFDFRL